MIRARSADHLRVDRLQGAAGDDDQLAALMDRLWPCVDEGDRRGFGERQAKGCSAQPGEESAAAPQGSDQQRSRDQTNDPPERPLRRADQVRTATRQTRDRGREQHDCEDERGQRRTSRGHSETCCERRARQSGGRAHPMMVSAWRPCLRREVEEANVGRTMHQRQGGRRAGAAEERQACDHSDQTQDRSVATCRPLTFAIKSDSPTPPRRSLAARLAS